MSHEIFALIIADPPRASKIILGSLKENGMHKGQTAEALGCTHGTLLRWIAKLELSDQIDRMVEKADTQGWRHNGRTGRPRGTTVANGAAPPLRKKKRKLPKKTSRRAA